MIPLNDDDFIYAVWTVSQPGKRDWYAVVKRNHGIGPWEGHSQFELKEASEFGPAGCMGGEGGIIKRTQDVGEAGVQINNAIKNLIDMGFGITTNFYIVNGPPAKLFEMMEQTPALQEIKTISCQ